ncbi:MAG: RNA 2',3'-cyclic phosphodiesterase [Phycisphaerae bacterium]|nr:RNA 2',3'-cyclic phosphodiesterase [Phycisphaerae bacterium]
MRLFVAIELEGRIKDALGRAQASLATHDRAVRWVTQDQMHLTLVFLGEVADGRVPAVCDAVRRAVGRCRPFDLTVSGSGCFPPGGGVRVVWVGVQEPTGRLQSLQAAVAEELEAMGFPKEDRPFSPHLTLGRVRDDRTRGELRADVDALSMAPLAQSVSAVHVVASELRSSGARYRTVAECALAGAS